MRKYYCIYGCQERDYHYGTPRGNDYSNKEIAISEAKKYCAGNDLVQVRGFIIDNGILDQVETIQIK